MAVRAPLLNMPAQAAVGAKPAMDDQELEGKAKDRDYLTEIKAGKFDCGGFIESAATADVTDKEYEALRKFIPQGKSGPEYSFEDNVQWLSGIANQTDDAGSGARKILGTIKHYLGE